MVAITQGSPRPRKTLTLFDPVTFPIAESAYSDSSAACLLAKVSGSDVPKATNVIAVAAGFIPNMHPNKLAYSPTTAVTSPININATTNANHPLA